MAEDIIIEEAEKIVPLTLNGSVVVGDLLAHNGTNWVQADASDATTNLYAQYLAMEKGDSGNVIKGCKKCVIYDADYPFTANTVLYLSATAGAYTHTRPTTAADVIQQVGRSIDTYRAIIDIVGPHAVEVFIQPSVYDTTDEAGLGIIDSPAWVGPGLDTSGEDAYFTSLFPSGVLSVELARVFYNSIGETTGTISAAIITVAPGLTNTGDTGAAFSAAKPTGEADNIVCYSDIAACFDADALKAGYPFTVAITGAGTFAGDLQVLGLYMRYICV